MVHGALSEILPVTSLVLSIPASGGVLVHLLVETTYLVLKTLIPNDLSNAFFRDAQGFGQLDAGSHAGFTSSRLASPSTLVFQFSLFLHDEWS